MENDKRALLQRALETGRVGIDNLSAALLPEVSYDVCLEKILASHAALRVALHRVTEFVNNAQILEERTNPGVRTRTILDAMPAYSARRILYHLNLQGVETFDFSKVSKSSLLAVRHRCLGKKTVAALEKALNDHGIMLAP